MPKPKLVLSNTTTFFSGNIEQVFKKAKKHGFKYLEILPYRWTRPEEVLRLEQKYKIRVAGIHMPEQWDKSLKKYIKQRPGTLAKLLPLLFRIYLGPAAINPGFRLSNLLHRHGQNPYLLFHSDLILEMGDKIFKKIANQYNLFIENAPYQKGVPENTINPLSIQKKLKEVGKERNIILDPAHLKGSTKKIYKLNLLQIYKQIKPRIIHIGYNDYGWFMHSLPNKKNQKELVQMLHIHMPEYIVLETNPLVSVKKGKEMIESILKRLLEG